MKLTTLLITLLLASCSILPEPGEETKKFTLEPLPFTENRASTLGPIIIDQPTVYPPLDQMRVAIKPTPETIDYISGIEWADRLSVMIHENMIQSFQNSGAFQSVGRLNSGLDGEYLLTVDVRKFEKSAVACCAEVEYFVQLTRFHDRKILGRKLFHETHPLQERDAVSVMSSINMANQKVMKSIETWVGLSIHHVPKTAHEPMSKPKMDTISGASAEKKPVAKTEVKSSPQP